MLRLVFIIILLANCRVQIKYEFENFPESLSTIEPLVAIAHWFPWPSNIWFLFFHTQFLVRAVFIKDRI